VIELGQVSKRLAILILKGCRSTADTVNMPLNMPLVSEIRTQENHFLPIESRHPKNHPVFWLLACFVCSGMSGLIYEVAWVRSLELIFGATTFAVATVLAAFMGGLALGSFCMGRVAHRFDRFHPLIVYGAIECLIAVFALSIPTLFHSLVPLYQLAWKYFRASFVWFSIIRFFFVQPFCSCRLF
jgi:MFS family permease